MPGFSRKPPIGARCLAARLEKDGVRVWLDANELTLGDSLRRTIDHGLAQSRYGLVILSPAFFSKAWPQNELNGLFALESARSKVILPVWHQVDSDFIARYSPLLADRLGISTSRGLDVVCEAVLKAIHEGVEDFDASPPAKPSSHRKIIFLAAALFLLMIAVGTIWAVIHGRSGDRFRTLKSAAAQSEASMFFRDRALAAGYTSSEILESWFGDFLFEHWISPEVIPNLLTRESLTQERGDLAIGIWNDSTAESSVWRISTGLTRPGVRPALTSIATAMKAPSIEPRTSPYRENAAGLSVASWSVVIGTYANSFPKAAGWICSNFAPQAPPFIDPRPRSDELEQLSVQPSPLCPPIKFLAVRRPGNESPAGRFRASLNLPAIDANNAPAETIYVSVARDNDPHPLPIRVSLLWLRSGQQSLTAQDLYLLNEKLRPIYGWGSYSHIDETQRSQLNEYADILIRAHVTHIIIEGHSDRVDAKMNLDLSRRRAEAVAEYLSFRGIRRESMEVIGFGGERALDANPQFGYNRRVVIRVLK